MTPQGAAPGGTRPAPSACARAIVEFKDDPHHRVRAATAASISEMFVLVDVTGLSRSQIAAKQLAHNSIEGQDNEQLLAEIYRQIEDAESKLEAFVDQKLDVELPR